jgi:hypothetical protein
MTTHPQLREPTKAQRRLAKKQDAFDRRVKENRLVEDLNKGAIHRPGSAK